MLWCLIHVPFFPINGVNTTHGTHVLKRKISSPMFLCLFSPSFLSLLASSPSSPPPSHGLRELLAIWTLALHCEHSLIASVLPTASQASQHGAPAVCLICHCSVVIHCGKKQRRNEERENLYKGCPCFLKPAVASSVFCSSPPQLLVLLTARDNQWCTQPDYFLSCFKIVLFCLFSVGDDPFTAPLLLYLS